MTSVMADSQCVIYSRHQTAYVQCFIDTRYITVHVYTNIFVSLFYMHGVLEQPGSLRK